MAFRKNRRKIGSRLSARVTLAALLFVAVFSMNGAWHAYQDSRQAANKRNTEAKELAELRDREYHLTAELGALETPRGVEAAIREKFGMVKEGEEVVVLPSDADGKDNGSGGSLWDRIRGWFTRE